MGLQQQLEQDFKTAYKNREQALVDLLRLLKAALKNEMINLKQTALKDDEVVKILSKEARKRQDAIELYKQGDRQELAEKEQVELDFINRYLPERMSEADIKKIVTAVVADMGEITPGQFGTVMSKVMAVTRGRADGAIVSQLVKKVVAP